MAGLYVHIPFCASRCIYCGFYSTTLLDLRTRYVDALCREIDLQDTHPQLETIYLGGGTPSQLSHDDLLRLFNYIYKVYPVATDAEVTMECNPDDIRPGLLRDLPVNRVSMGAQTFYDDRLHLLHRRHSAAEVDGAVSILRADGIRNISIDLMFGFPNEKENDWQRDIDHALELEPEHISAYGLMYEEGTPLYRMREQGKVSEIDEELSIAMYETLIDRLTAADYEHYEISNFAKLSADDHARQGVSSYRSRHNSSYWHDIPYVGLGAAAHSYDGHSRHWAVADLRQYIRSIDAGQLPYTEEVIDESTHYDDLITTALRTREGLDLDRLTPAYRSYLLTQAQPYLDKGMLALTGRRLHLTRSGILLSNTIMSDLMHV